jgi:hypothetical protein
MDEKERERIASSPFLVFANTFGAFAYNMSELFIEIEVKGKDEKFILSEKRTQFGDRRSDMGEHGTALYNEIRGKYGFGKVTVKTQTHADRPFPNYNEFIMAIAS